MERIPDLTGYFIPLGRDGCPILLAFQQVADRFVPVFSSLDKIEVLRSTYHLTTPPRVQTIGDGALFLASMRTNDAMPFKIRIAVDPYRHPECGNIHFQEIPLALSEEFS